METLNFNIRIAANAKTIWSVLWNDETYRKWTAVFSEGSYAESDWKEGSPILFLTPSGEGMSSIIHRLIENKEMTFKHLSTVKDFQVQPLDEKSQQWSGCRESYTIEEVNGMSTFRVSIEVMPGYKDYFIQTFPKALEKVKILAEHAALDITLQAMVKAPLAKVWHLWTSPEHIIQWNNATEEWCTPAAKNELKKGGSFSYRMESKDGKHGFDFSGTYKEIIPEQRIAYTIEDGRNVLITFEENPSGVLITESFQAENLHSRDLQRQGWQAILDNFQRHAETSPDLGL
jgi:uncharacterized protein YndB with AHSA1/START domain